MRILLWSDVYPPYRGGLEKMTQVLAHGLTSRGHDVAVVTSHFDLELADQAQEGPVQVYRLPMQPALLANDLRRVASCLAKVAAIKRAFQPQVVHVQSEAVSSFFHMQTHTAWPCPMFLTMHGEIRKFRTGHGTLLGSLFDRSTWVSTISRALLDAVRECAPVTRGKSSVIYNAVPGLTSQAAARPHQTLPVIMACGRLAHEKGLDLLLIAFQSFLKKVPGASLVLAGAGPDSAALKEMAGQLGIHDQVEFPGWLAPDELGTRMCEAAMIMVPSRWEEPFCLVALEAAMLGLPVIAAKIGGLPEVVQDGQTGVLVPPEDPDALLVAMLSLWESPERRKEMGDAARVRAGSLFRPAHMLHQYESMYRNELAPAP